MDLNSIKLPVHLIEELYGNSLVHFNKAGIPAPDKTITPDPAPVEMIVQEAKWKSLGNNHKNILILVKNPGIRFLPDTELQFLSTILSACKLGMADVAIVNLADNENANNKEMIIFFKSRIVMLFDIEPASFGLPMKFPHYQIQPFASCSFLYAPSLEILEKNIEEKKKLWTSLKRMFNI